LAILKLDEHFSDLSRLGARIDEIDMKSNFDFEQSERLIMLFAQAGQAVSEDIAEFVAVLNESRTTAEAAAQKVAGKADQIRARKEDIQQKMSRFETLSEKVNQLNQSLMQFKRPTGEALSQDEQTQLKAQLAAIGNQLQILIEEAQELKSVGQEAKIKVLEQNAESMRQSLIAVSQKISGLTLQ
jgi:uncharacterized coiled-coil DUF342 family protein